MLTTKFALSDSKLEEITTTPCYSVTDVHLMSGLFCLVADVSNNEHVKTK